ncbi:MAG: glutamine-hydrolyzing carbamoyl-phosphate synthase small subunit [Fimbriimonadaceae bacterium]|nr:glutamine-hydrolyzing carbamoyl-phosphate synthase small subunit [Fimbriimonadaceae bacterium]
MRYLLLSDGTVYSGAPLGADADAIGEVVFNTGMTGYQEVLSDPSYAGQIVLFTYPLIGNYGINADDFESARLQAAGVVVKEACDAPSNWRSTRLLHDLLKERGLVGIQGVDTRAITKRIRSGGVAMGMITDRNPEDAFGDLRAARTYDETDFVERVTTKSPYAWGYAGFERIDEPMAEYRRRLVVLDCGLKYNILRRFAALGCRSIVLPATTPADEVLGWEPDGVLFSPGPGDPARLPTIVQTARDLLGKTPIFGICLGNQILCQALGGRTFKLKFGHRGANHPVQDLRTGKVTITSQNHGYAVDPSSLPSGLAEVTQLNVNDGTVEGIRAKDFDATSIQYHPEAAPGPWDSRPYFAEFVEKMGAGRR